MPTTDELTAEPEAIRASVGDRYRAGMFRHRLGRRLAALLRYDRELDRVPDRPEECSAGAAEPLLVPPFDPDAHVLDVGSSARFDCFVVAAGVGQTDRAASRNTTRYLHDVLDPIAYRIASQGTQCESVALEVLAAAARPLCPSAAEALVDWTGPEIVRLRAFGIVHGALVRGPSRRRRPEAKRVPAHTAVSDDQPWHRA